MKAEEFDRKLEELKNKLAAGKIKDEDYWDELQSLEKEVEELEYKGLRPICNDIMGTGFRIFLYSIPLLILMLASYLLFFYYPSPKGISNLTRDENHTYERF